MIRDIKLELATLASKIAAATVLCLIAVASVPALAHAQSNLLQNPDLSAGTGDSPQYWQHDAYTGPAGTVTFEWLNYEQPAELEVYNYEPYDSRWTQTLHLKPGWYHFTASVRTENVGVSATGANISIMETWFQSRNLTGTNYWEPIGFYMQILQETDVKFACRIGFYSSENTGRAFFRDLSVTKVDAPGADDPSFKLESKDRPPSDKNKPWLLPLRRQIPCASLYGSRIGRARHRR